MGYWTVKGKKGKGEHLL